MRECGSTVPTVFFVICTCVRLGRYETGREREGEEGGREREDEEVGRGDRRGIERQRLIPSLSPLPSLSSRRANTLSIFAARLKSVTMCVCQRVCVRESVCVCVSRYLMSPSSSTVCYEGNRM